MQESFVTDPAACFRIEKRPVPFSAGSETIGIDTAADGIDQRFKFAMIESVVVVNQRRTDVIRVFAGIVNADRIPVFYGTEQRRRQTD